MTNNDTLQQRVKSAWIFLACWLLTFVLYFPAGRAGWVIDGVGFLYNIRHQSFWDFINRTNSSDQSFYQLFTLHYYFFYKLWGFNVWLWSLLYITVQAINAFLLFLLCRNMLFDSGVRRYVLIPLAGIALFTISPHISEIIVCRAYFHYLLSFMFILMGMYWTQQYHYNERSRYFVYTTVLFILSSFTLEIFYLTPFLLLALALYYRLALGYDKEKLKKVILYGILPQLLLLVVYFIALVAVYKHLKPHKIGIDQTATDYLSKLPKYILHIVFLGRYFSLEAKRTMYAWCSTWLVIIMVYGVVFLGVGYAMLRITKMRMEKRPLVLLCVLALLTLLFILPLAFPRPELLVFYDRYTYFTDAFIYMLLALAAATWIKSKYLNILLFCVYADFNLFFTIELNTAWIDSDKINTHLLRSLPDTGDKTVLLLNIPENMIGAPMIGSSPDGEFKMMHEVYTDTVLKQTIYDVASYNMFAGYNGAHVIVVNDSVLRVGLNHGGTWWWYDGHGATDYETPEYKLELMPRMEYELILKHPADKYSLYYNVGDQWKSVNMELKNKQQD